MPEPPRGRIETPLRELFAQLIESAGEALGHSPGDVSPIATVRSRVDELLILVVAGDSFIGTMDEAMHGSATRAAAGKCSSLVHRRQRTSHRLRCLAPMERSA